jgi:Holliday junction DNA helicase RuvB
MGAHLKITSGPAIEKTGEIAAILNGLEEHDVLFIDEIHRLNRQVEEFLYSAMEDYAIDILIGKGPMAKSVRLGLPKFTLVGATTMSGNLSAPLRARFGMAEKLEYYTDRELMMIIMASADKLNVSIDSKGAELLAMRSRGTPRIANRLLKRVRDYAQVQFDGVITDEVVETSLELLGVDTLGLDDANLAILRVMAERFEGKPVGLDNLAASIGEDANTIKEVYEPFLLQKGLIIRTPRGRKITKIGYEYLGLEHLYKESE